MYNSAGSCCLFSLLGLVVVALTGKFGSVIACSSCMHLTLLSHSLVTLANRVRCMTMTRAMMTTRTGETRGRCTDDDGDDNVAEMTALGEIV